MMFRGLCVVILLFCFSLKAEHAHIETNDITHVMNYLEEGTLFVFDLDNTLIETAQHLGSDQWFAHQLQHYIRQGNTPQEALDRLVPELGLIYQRTHMRLVDPAIPHLLDNMRQRKVAMIALTKRSPKFAEKTLEHLAELRIDFSKTSDLLETFTFEELDGSIYRNGVIFIANNGDKGAHMAAFLKRLPKMPHKIVLIDDKISHVQSVSDSLESLHIPFVGIRYGGADETVKKFDPKIADLQWKLLHKIISNEEAQQLLSTTPTSKMK